MEIIDREDIRNAIGDELDAFSDRQAHIIRAPSGFGKSYVTECILKGHSAHPALKVVQRGDVPHQPGDYLREIVRQVCEPFNGVSFPFEPEGYIADLVDQKRATDLALEGMPIPSFARKAIGAIVGASRYKKRLTALLSDGLNSEDLAFCFQFLRLVLPPSPFILNIENVQSIDDYSLRKLPDVLKECKSFYLLLEVTSASGLGIRDITKRLIEPSLCRDPEIDELEMLDPSAIISYERRRGNADIGWLQQELSAWDGNVRNLVDSVHVRKTAGRSDMSGGTKCRIASLAPRELETLRLIAIDYEPVTLSALKLMGFGAEADELLSEPNSMIKKVEDRIAITHDSIAPLTFWDSKQRTNTARRWLDYYEGTGFDSTPPRIRNLKRLHYSMVVGDLLNLVDVMQDIKPFICGSADPLPTIRSIERIYLKQSVDNPGCEGAEELLIWLIDLYQSVLDYKKARVLVAQLPPDNAYCQPLQVLLDYRCHHYETARDKATRLIENERDIHRRLWYKLIHLESCYELGDTEACKADFEHLEENGHAYSRFVEYGFFYRNAELVKDYRTCIEYQSKGIEHFERFDASKQAVSTRMTRGVHYALIGEFDLAMQDFIWAEEHKGDYVGLLHECLNNQAVVQMRQGDLEGVEGKLERARLLPMTPFDRMAINLSLLGYCTHLGRDNPAIVNELEEALTGNDYLGPVIRQYAHIALYKHYLLIGQKTEAEEHLKMADRTRSMPRYVRYWITGEKTDRDDIHYFRDAFDQPLTFISEWGIEFDYRLMRFR